MENKPNFTDFFPRQCKPVINDSILLNFSYLTNEKIDQVPIGNEDIVSLIHKLNPNKANGSDGISGQMLLLCDDLVILPPQNNLRKYFYQLPHNPIWKLANLTPIFKKKATNN